MYTQGMMDKNAIQTVYEALYARFGPQHWWPGDTPLEVCIGAILTQNAAWSNVEKAIHNLKQAHVMDLDKLRRISTKRLAQLIRPSGYFNIKADRLKCFVLFVFERHHNRLESVFQGNMKERRADLLNVKGIGQETADSMLLYAGKRHVFVVDAYTRRIFSRLGIIKGDEPYDVIQAVFEGRLARSVRLYNEYHALVVALGKDICRPRPQCGRCPLVCPTKRSYI